MERPVAGRPRLSIDVGNDLLKRIHQAVGGSNNTVRSWVIDAVERKLKEQSGSETQSMSSSVRFSQCRPDQLVDNIRRFSEDATYLIDIVGHSLPILLLQTESFAQFLRRKVEQGTSLAVVFTGSEVDDDVVNKLRELERIRTANQYPIVEIWGMTSQTIAPRNEYILVDDNDAGIAKGLMVVNEPTNPNVQLLEFRAEKDSYTYGYLARNAKLAAMKQL